MISGNDRRSENNKHIEQETFLDRTWTQKSYLYNWKYIQNMAAMFSLNYQFNENHSLGMRYNYDRTPEFHDDIDMQTDVAQNNIPYEKSSSVGWQNHVSSGHTLNTYYNGQVGDWHIDFNVDGIWQKNRIPQEMLEKLFRQTVNGKNRLLPVRAGIKIHCMPPNLWRNIRCGKEISR